MAQVIQVEGVGPVEFPDDASQDEIYEYLNRQYPPPKVSGLRAAIQHAATGVGPGVAFTQAFPLGAAYGAGLTALIPGVGETGVAEAIGAGIGGLATGTTAAILASKAQRAGLRAIAPTFAQKLETELAAGEAQHPYLSAAGEVASLAPSAKLAPLALRTLPFRAALGAGVGAALPVVTDCGQLLRRLFPRLLSPLLVQKDSAVYLVGLKPNPFYDLVMGLPFAGWQAFSLNVGELARLIRHRLDRRPVFYQNPLASGFGYFGGLDSRLDLGLDRRALLYAIAPAWPCPFG